MARERDKEWRSITIVDGSAMPQISPRLDFKFRFTIPETLRVTDVYPRSLWDLNNMRIAVDRLPCTTAAEIEDTTGETTTLALSVTDLNKIKAGFMPSKTARKACKSFSASEQSWRTRNLMFVIHTDTSPEGMGLIELVQEQQEGIMDIDGLRSSCAVDKEDDDWSTSGPRWLISGWDCLP